MSVATLKRMSAYLKNRSQGIYARQQKRSREHSGQSVPYSLDQLRLEVIIPRVCNPRCVYCDLIVISESSFQIDHVIPLSRGGSWELANLILCCGECNAIKGSLTGEEYIALRAWAEALPYEARVDVFRRMKIGGNPMAARLLGSSK
jgi:5-methylcytosine-specific restriction endonuclease McrA